MSAAGPLETKLWNMLKARDLRFREFVEVALYDPDDGYYATTKSPVGEGADYITSPLLSPVFAFALSRLCSEFLSRAGDEVSSIVDIGCGDGALIHSLASSLGASVVRFVGVDRYLDRIPAERREGVTWTTSLDEVPRDGRHLIISNELFDAVPFARVVQRGSGLNELYVTLGNDGALDWSERPAGDELTRYFESRGIELEEGQFADIAPEWEAIYESIASIVTEGLIVTFDYGFPESKLFHPRARRFGTAAAYRGHKVNRDLLAEPGRQDLTAHINFDDLIRTGERLGFGTLSFVRQAEFLLALGITNHELFTPVTDVRIASAEEGIELLQRRDAARQLVLPDGIGHDIRVMVQGKGLGNAPWSFQSFHF